MPARLLAKLSPASIAIIAVVLIVMGYAAYQLEDVLVGPRIIISSPADGASFTEPLVKVSGIAKNIANITLNDLPIFVDAEGAFKKKLLLTSGYNIIKISAKDRFGRETTEILRLVLNKESEKQ